MMRMGRRHQPFYRVVVVPRQQRPGRSRYVEKLGWVDPLQHTQSVDHERAKYWMGVGAQPSDTVWNLFVREGIVEGEKRRKGKSGVTKEVEAVEETEGGSEESAPTEEAAPQEEEAPAAEGGDDTAPDTDEEAKGE